MRRGGSGSFAPPPADSPVALTLPSQPRSRHRHPLRSISPHISLPQPRPRSLRAISPPLPASAASCSRRPRWSSTPWPSPPHSPPPRGPVIPAPPGHPDDGRRGLRDRHHRVRGHGPAAADRGHPRRLGPPRGLADQPLHPPRGRRQPAIGDRPMFEILPIARFVSVIPNSSFFSVTALVTARLSPPTRRAQSVSAMMLDLAISTMVGVPPRRRWPRRSAGARPKGSSSSRPWPA